MMDIVDQLINAQYMTSAIRKEAAETITTLRAEVEQLRQRIAYTNSVEQVPAVSVPEVNTDLVAAILEDYAEMQTSGFIPSANRYPAADAMEQAAMLSASPAPKPDELTQRAIDLYQPPFRFDKYGYVWDAAGQMIADNHVDDDAEAAALRVRGWGRISYMENPEALQDRVGELIAAALTAYWSPFVGSTAPTVSDPVFVKVVSHLTKGETSRNLTEDEFHSALDAESPAPDSEGV